MAATRPPQGGELSQVQPIQNTADAQIGSSGKRPTDTQIRNSKRMRLAEEEETINFAQVDIQHPQPRSVSSRYAAFLQSNQDPSTRNLVSAWLELFDSDRERHSRSDSCLYDDSRHEPTGRPRSLPTPATMSEKGNNGGFAVPAIPSATNRFPTTRPTSESDAANDSIRSGNTNLVNQVDYRQDNLEGCRIFLRELSETLPDHVARVVQGISARRDSPGPSVETVVNDKDLMHLSDPGVPESRIESHFNATIFVRDSVNGLDREERGSMQRHLIPPAYSRYNISVPVPDAIMGYNQYGFTNHREHISAIRSEVKGTNSGLLYPFLVVEYKAEDGPLWVAVNQCLGGAACCVNLLEQFHAKLLRAGCEGLRPEDRVAFSIAMNGTLARIHVTWFSNGKNYFTQQFRALSLQDPQQYIEFYRLAKNIMDWGKIARLQEIRNGLDRLKKENALEMTYTPPRR